MMKHSFAFIALAVLAPHAAAQQHLSHPNAADPATVVPPVKYESAFIGYTSYREQEPASWRELNDEVARIGGHARMFGGAGHAGHGGAKSGPAKAAPGQPAASKDQPAGQGSASQAPRASHKSH
jgi:hypothetical protein